MALNEIPEPVRLQMAWETTRNIEQRMRHIRMHLALNHIDDARLAAMSLIDAGNELLARLDHIQAEVTT